MALKATIESLDEIDEALHEHYQKKGDVYVLGVDGITEHPSVTALQNAHERQKKENRSLKIRVEEADARLEAFGELTIDELEALREKAESGGTGRPSEEELTELLDKRFGVAKQRYEKQIESLTGERDAQVASAKKYQEALAQERIFNQVKDNAVKAGVRDKALGLITRMATDVWRIDESGEAAAYNGDEPMNGSHGPITMREWVDSLRDEHDYLFKPSEGAGSAGNRENARGAGSPRVITGTPSSADIDAMARGEAVRAT